MKYAHPGLAALAWLTVSAPTFAQQGAFQLGLGTGFLTYSSNSTEIENYGRTNSNYDLDSSSFSWGLHSSSGVQFEGGYALSDSLIVGGLLTLGGSSNKLEPEGESDQKTTTFNLFLGPKLDYLFLPGSVARPFIGGALGLVADTTDYTNADGTGIDTGLSGWGIGLLGRAGIRWFVTPGFSIDPALVFGGRWLSGEADYENASFDASTSSFTLGLNVAMSGWIK